MSEWKEEREPFLHLKCSSIELIHGFAGVGSAAPRPRTDESFESVRKALRVDYLFHLKQVHGIDAACLDVKVHSSCHRCDDADMFFIKNDTVLPGAYLVKTADCTPIIICSKDYTAVIHAGWRGVVGGIVEKVVALFTQKLQEHITVAIGPCADKCCYEVGEEVWSHFNPIAVQNISSTANSKRTISLAAEVSHRFISAAELNRITVQVLSSDVCTLCDNRFHSYRREGDDRGTNITYVVI